MAAIWQSAMSRHRMLDLGATREAGLVDAARDSARIAGLTHDYYRYPARFSPTLVRAVIEAFSAPADLILDPFMGGGTTMVEAIALRRDAIGTDISSLATFIAEVKTTIYSDSDLAKLSRWASKTIDRVNMHHLATKHDTHFRYQRNLGYASTWRLKKAIGQCLAAASRLRPKRLENLARCVVLRTAQWALDGRRTYPTVEQFRQKILDDSAAIITGAADLRKALVAHPATARSKIRCLNRPISGLEKEPIFRSGRKPKLVVTSPPYPGVHVLYHRWQVDGRKETPAPFWIANRLDGSGASYYTMGDRHAIELTTYFDQLRDALRSIRSVCASDTTIVQVVAFSDPSWQLSRYLSVANDVGLIEHFLPSLRTEPDGRLWRSVPNRKWHANQKGATGGSQEVVLFHKMV